MLSPIMKINTGRRMMINRQEWVVDGYMSLIERDTPLTLEEGRQLRVDDIIKIAKWREIKVAIGVWCDMQDTGTTTSPQPVTPAFGRTTQPASGFGAFGAPSSGSGATHPRNARREAPVKFRPYIREQAYNREAVKSSVQNDLYPSHDHTAAY